MSHPAETIIPPIGEQLNFQNVGHVQEYLHAVAQGLDGKFYPLPAPKTQLTDDLEAIYQNRVKYVRTPTLTSLGEISLTDSWCGSVNAMHRTFASRDGLHEQITGHGFAFMHKARIGREEYDLSREVVVGIGLETGYAKVAVGVAGSVGDLSAFDKRRREVEGRAKWAIDHAIPAGLPSLGKGKK